MKKLSIIIPYFNRNEALERLKKTLNILDMNKFDIIISEIPAENSGKFNTAKAQNLGIEKSTTEWIMKNDVDCIPEDIKLYYDALNEIQNMNENDYLIYGAKYLDKNENLSKFHQCGNEYLISKSLWEKVGRVPEWTGYGFEDYAFEYSLEKNKNPNFKVPYFEKPRDVSNFLRDNLVKIKNNENKYWFLHYWHKPVYLAEYVQMNLKKLWEFVMKNEGYIK